MNNLIHTVYLWLAAMHPLLPWIVLTGIPCFVLPWAVRTFAPNVWERLPSAVDKACVRLNIPLDGFWNKFLAFLTQTLPTAAMAAAGAAWAAHENVAHAYWVAVGGACAVPLHHLAKMIPWIPYVGGAFPAAGRASQKAPKLLTLLLVAILAFPVGLTGCSAIPALLPIISGIVAVVQEAQSVLDKIDAVSQVVLPSLPKDVQVQWAKKMANTRQALAGISKLAQGGKDLQQQDVDAAFAEFAAAYRDLTAFAEDIGLMSTAPGGDVHVHVAGAKAGLHVVIVDPAAARQRPVQVAR